MGALFKFALYKEVLCVLVCWKGIVLSASLCYLLPLKHKTPHCSLSQIQRSLLLTFGKKLPVCRNLQFQRYSLHSYKWHHSLWLYNALGESLFLWTLTALLQSPTVACVPTARCSFFFEVYWWQKFCPNQWFINIVYISYRSKIK